MLNVLVRFRARTLDGPVRPISRFLFDEFANSASVLAGQVLPKVANFSNSVGDCRL